MEKEFTCPWCNKTTIPKINILKKQYGNVKERRCGECAKVLAAYPEGEVNYFPKIRNF